MRLIDADALMKQLVRAHLTYENGEEALGYTTVCFGSAIRNAPTIDAEPVRHGHWVSEYSSSYTYKEQVIRPGGFLPIGDNGSPIGACKCSVCNEYLIASDEYDVFGYYCPNCGAKMDEEVTT